MLLAKRQTILPILFFIVFLDQLGLMLIVPLLPDLLSELTGLSNAENSLWSGALTTIYALMQFGFAPLIGALGDRYGRKPILIWCLGFFALDYVIIALAGSVWLLFLGRLLTGITGASAVVAFACVADVSSPAERGKRFAQLFGATGLGMVVGPLFGGFLGQFGLRTPFWIAAALCLANALLVALILPETLPKEKRREAKIKNPFAGFAIIMEKPGFRPLLFGQFLVLAAFQAPIVIIPFFFKEKFHLDSFGVAAALTVFAIMYSAVQFFVTPIALRKLGNAKSVYIGFGFLIFGFFFSALAPNLKLLCLVAAIYCLGYIASSAATSIFSANVGSDEQGTLQGVLVSANSLGSIVGPSVMSFMFFSELKYFPILSGGTPFLLGAVILSFATWCFHLGFKKLQHLD